MRGIHGVTKNAVVNNLSQKQHSFVPLWSKRNVDVDMDVDAHLVESIESHGFGMAPMPCHGCAKVYWMCDGGFRDRHTPWWCVRDGAVMLGATLVDGQE